MLSDFVEEGSHVPLMCDSMSAISVAISDSISIILSQHTPIRAGQSRASPRQVEIS
jgi:hypothetical protein